MGGECSGDCADNMVKLMGKSDFSKCNSDRSQLYPNAEWFSRIFPQEHNSGVLTAAVLLFYTFLSSASITSHVAGLNDVGEFEGISKQQILKDGLQPQKRKRPNYFHGG